jgi:excisionase family DNA binding protein
MTKPLLTVDEVAAILRVAPSTLTEWRRTGDPDLPYVRINGRIRYRADDVEQFLAEAGSDDDDDEPDDEAEADDDDDGDDNGDEDDDDD